MQSAFNETKTHGTLTFPYTVYKVDIPEFLRAYPPHLHAAAELIYIENGGGTVCVDACRYAAERGDIFIVPPETAHAIEQDGDRAMRYFNVLFDPSILGVSAADPCYRKYIAPFSAREKRPPAYVPNGSALNAALRPHLDYLVQNRHAGDDELMIKSELFAIMSCITRHAEAACEQAAPSRAALMPALRLVCERYGEKLTVTDAAESCGYSPSHFMKLFKAYTGKSFAEYLIEYRVEAAASMLADTDKKILDVALDAGFDNPSYFARAIRAKYGLTPSEYRAAARKKQCT